MPFLCHTPWPRGKRLAWLPPAILTIQARTWMLERHASVTNELAPPGGTPTLDTLPRRLADFATLGEALDYAAMGRRGLNFHDARGTLTLAYPYAQLREDALVEARRFVALGIKPADRIALVAET